MSNRQPNDFDINRTNWDVAIMMWNSYNPNQIIIVSDDITQPDYSKTVDNIIHEP